VVQEKSNSLLLLVEEVADILKMVTPVEVVVEVVLVV
jgi:hypothetical protein